MKSVSHFHDGGRYHIETNLLICGANQWIGFYMISASVMKGLTLSSCPDYFYFIFWNTGFFYKKNQAKIGKKASKKSYLKIIRFLHARYHPKIEHVLKNV